MAYTYGIHGAWRGEIHQSPASPDRSTRGIASPVRGSQYLQLQETEPLEYSPWIYPVRVQVPPYETDGLRGEFVRNQVEWSLPGGRTQDIRWPDGPGPWTGDA